MLAGGPTTCPVSIIKMVITELYKEATVYDTCSAPNYIRTNKVHGIYHTC